jgi:hypothetical protein
MKLLDLNSLDDNLTTLKKRRFRQLERYNFDDELEPFEGSASKSKVSGKSKNDKKGMKLNEKLLRKASATVDLISHKAKQKHMMQETVTACFVTNVIELTKDALDKIAPNQQLAVPISEEQQQMVSSWGMNLRFIKPSHNFYNEVMSNWFKYLHILEQQREENNLPLEWKPIELQQSFMGFCISLLKTAGSWQESMKRPLEFYSFIIAKEYCILRNNNSDNINDEQLTVSSISMCSFFDNVKNRLLKRWEKDIVQKSSKFQQQQTTV